MKNQKVFTVATIVALAGFISFVYAIFGLHVEDMQDKTMGQIPGFVFVAAAIVMVFSIKNKGAHFKKGNTQKRFHSIYHR